MTPEQLLEGRKQLALKLAEHCKLEVEYAFARKAEYGVTIGNREWEAKIIAEIACDVAAIVLYAKDYTDQQVQWSLSYVGNVASPTKPTSWELVQYCECDGVKGEEAPALICPVCNRARV